MERLLVSCFERLLSVMITRDGGLGRVRVLHEGMGVYFGLTTRGRAVFAAERNLDVVGQRRVEGAPVNAVRKYAPGRFGGLRRSDVALTHPGFSDLHQVAEDAGALFLTSATPPWLWRYCLATHAVTSVPVGDAVPAELARAPDDNPDLYHFNAIGLRGLSLFLMAHNWGHGSFALELDRAAAHRGQAVRRAVHTDLGEHNHDVLPDDTGFWTIDSRFGTLVRAGRDGSRHRYPLESPQGRIFPRGLARLRSGRLALGYGLWSSERAVRAETPSFLRIFDPSTGTFGPELPLGDHGNTCAVMTQPR
ncbi:MAG: hypothetical protein AAF160_20735 [Pseudomonadota bacterium]